MLYVDKCFYSQHYWWSGLRAVDVDVMLPLLNTVNGVPEHTAPSSDTRMPVSIHRNFRYSGISVYRFGFQELTEFPFPVALHSHNVPGCRVCRYTCRWWAAALLQFYSRWPVFPDRSIAAVGLGPVARAPVNVNSTLNATMLHLHRLEVAQAGGALWRLTYGQR